MKSPANFIFAIALISVASAARAMDHGQFENVPADVRAWFKNVMSPRGILCCDIADGHRTNYDMRQNAYWVPINGKWIKVPEEAVIQNAGNPVGDAIVWYAQRSGDVTIRCFVPGGGA